MNTPLDVSSRVRRILSTRGLTLYQVSRESARIFGRHSPYYLPDRFYSDLKARNAVPAIQQLVALSRISGYRLADYLAVFGVSPDNIPRLQILLPRRRTLLLDASVYDESDWVPWFAGRPRPPTLPAIAPLAQALEPAPPARAGRLLTLNTRHFLYAKIGMEDTLAFPDLAPGSIVRIDPSQAADAELALTAVPTRRIFLVQTTSRLACGHLRRIGGNRVALCSTSFPYPPFEFTLGRDATIFGVVDAEIRSVGPGRASGAQAPGPARRTVPLLPLENGDGPLGRLIRASRIRQGLSFREASAMSRSIASVLGDPHYFASPGTLFGCDRLTTPPACIQKILSLCILYGIGFWDFVGAGGLELDSLGKDALPDDLCGRAFAPNLYASPEMQVEETEIAGRENFLGVLMDQWKEIPLFLRRSLAEITGLPGLSLLDFFLLGPQQIFTDLPLRNAVLVAINRRLKKPVSSTPPAVREQRVYMLVGREGVYLCAPCTLERGILALHRQSSMPLPVVNTETRTDLEVVGQVTAVLRWLS